MFFILYFPSPTHPLIYKMTWNPNPQVFVSPFIFKIEDPNDKFCVGIFDNRLSLLTESMLQPVQQTGPYGRPEADPGGGLRGLQPPPPFGKFSNLSGYPCLSLFHTKSSSPIDHFKKTVAFPLLDSLIIQMQDRFLTKIGTPAICLV